MRIEFAWLNEKQKSDFVEYRHTTFRNRFVE